MKKDVLIIGAGLTGLSLAFYLKAKGKDVLLVERQNRAGGSIRTFRENGYVFESGPNTGALSSPEIAELFEGLADSCKLEPAHKEAARRLILKNGKLEALPSGCFSGLATGLFTWKDKFNILREPFFPKGTDPLESVASMVRRRLGRSYLDYAVNPFISGIYAGDPETLVTKFALPKLYALEQDYGSFIRGAIAKAKLPKTEREKKATKEVFSANGGLGHLIEALLHKVGEENVVLGNERIQIEENAPFHYRVRLPETEVETPWIVSTVGSYALSAIFPFAESSLMKDIDNLRYAPVVQASVGIKISPSMDLHAFGALFPEKEKRDTLGILYPSSCFSGRAPEGYALLSFFIGGMKKPDCTNLSDEEIKTIVMRDLHYVYHDDSLRPEFIRIFRHSKAIPQYEANSGTRLDAVAAFQKRYPGILLGGNLRDGIGMSDRVKQAYALAEEILQNDI